MTSTTGEAWFEGMAMEADHSEYEHAGIWHCTSCGQIFWVTYKWELTSHFQCPEHPNRINPRELGVPSYLPPTDARSGGDSGAD